MENPSAVSGDRAPVGVLERILSAYRSKSKMTSVTFQKNLEIFTKMRNIKTFVFDLGSKNDVLIYTLQTLRMG